MYIDLLSENIKIKVNDKEIKLFRVITLKPIEVRIPNFRSNLKYSNLKLSWDIITIDKYTIGGWAESLDIFDSETHNWVGMNAKVWGNVKLLNQTYVNDYSKVWGNAIIDGSYISDYASIMANTHVMNSWVADYALLKDSAKIDNTKMVQSTQVSNNATVTNSCLFDGSYVIKNAIIDNCILKDTAMIGGDAIIRNSTLTHRSSIVTGEHNDKQLEYEVKLNSTIPESLYGTF